MEYTKEATLLRSAHEELEQMVTLLSLEGEVMRDRFKGLPLLAWEKDGKSDVTDLDVLMNTRLVEYYMGRGILTVSEEGGTAQYGRRNVMILDPVDSTSDVIEGQKRSPRVSNGAISLGMLTHKGLEVGGTCFPLLDLTRPLVVYGGGPEFGAFRKIKRQREYLQINTRPTRGVVFTSSKTRAFNNRLKEAGFTPVVLHGAVFKGCAFIDPGLAGYYKLPGLSLPKDVPVVGFVTNGHLHDIAATVPIARAAGAVVTSRTGGEIDFGTGRGCVMANNSKTHECLLDLIAE